MELAFLLRGVGAEVVWITNQKPVELDDVVYSLEHKMLDRGVKVTFSNSYSAVFSSISFALSFWEEKFKIDLFIIEEGAFVWFGAQVCVFEYWAVFVLCGFGLCKRLWGTLIVTWISRFEV